MRNEQKIQKSVGKIWDNFLVFSSKKGFVRDAGAPGRVAVLPHRKGSSIPRQGSPSGYVLHTTVACAAGDKDGLAARAKIQPSWFVYKFSARGGVTSSSKAVFLTSNSASAKAGESTGGNVPW